MHRVLINIHKVRDRAWGCYTFTTVQPDGTCEASLVVVSSAAGQENVPDEATL